MINVITLVNGSDSKRNLRIIFENLMVKQNILIQLCGDKMEF